MRSEACTARRMKLLRYFSGCCRIKRKLWKAPAGSIAKCSSQLSGTNMDGSDRRVPFVFGKSKKPRFFRSSASTRTFYLRENIIKANYIYDFQIPRSFYCSSLLIQSFLMHSASLQARTHPTNTRNTDNWHQQKFCNNYKLQSLEHTFRLILNSYNFAANFSLAKLKLFFSTKE